LLLSVKNLSVSIEKNKILNNLSLDIKEGEIHAIMGPNGSGKSTFSNVLAGKEEYNITNGEVKFRGSNLLNLNIEERSLEGLFLAFQYPVEVPGVSITPFLQTAVNSRLKAQGKKEVDVLSFAKKLKETANKLGFTNDMLKRSVNEGFSGGEKKRFEILQMSILNPKLSILDETDSGLDVDALKIVTEGVNNLKNKTSSFLIITHYERLLNYIVPDYVHVMVKGRIVKSGDKSIAQKIEQFGYKEFL
jgi:Fe-S cluster assembly ATP-binding protein